MGPRGPMGPMGPMGPGPMLTFVTLRGPWAQGPVVESYKKKTRILESYKRRTRILESYKRKHVFLKLIKGEHISLGGRSPVSGDVPQSPGTSPSRRGRPPSLGGRPPASGDVPQPLGTSPSLRETSRRARKTRFRPRTGSPRLRSGRYLGKWKPRPSGCLGTPKRTEKTKNPQKKTGETAVLGPAPQGPWGPWALGPC